METNEQAPDQTGHKKGTPTADVRRYFPKVATIHGTTATDANALHQLAVWLLHWSGRPEGTRYSLSGQMKEQMAATPSAGKFLKACGRLHEALTPLTASVQNTKALLGREYTPHSRDYLAEVLTWWAGWIREQTEAQTDPAAVYLAALKRVQIVTDWENSPRYTLPAPLLDVRGFTAEIAPLRKAFEAALPDLAEGKKRALCHSLNELLVIDRAGVQLRQEQFERGEYALNFLPADYPALHFDVAGEAGGFKWQGVGPLFWGGLRTLLQFKQEQARAAVEKLNATLAMSPPPPTTAAALDTPTPSTPQPEAHALTVADLCRNGFTPADLTTLLQRLAVVDAEGTCLNPTLRGKARGQLGAFTAAYRVLHREGLMAPTTNKQWATAFQKEYRVTLGADVIAHKITAHGHAPKSATGPFQKAVADAADWLAEWKISH